MNGQLSLFDIIYSQEPEIKRPRKHGFYADAEYVRDNG